MNNLQYIPTKKLIEILDSHHTTGTNGADYGPVKHELESILWERQERISCQNERIIEQYWSDYQDHLDSIGVSA